MFVLICAGAVNVSISNVDGVFHSCPDFTRWRLKTDKLLLLDRYSAGWNTTHARTVDAYGLDLTFEGGARELYRHVNTAIYFKCWNSSFLGSHSLFYVMELYS